MQAAIAHETEQSHDATDGGAGARPFHLVAPGTPALEQQPAAAADRAQRPTRTMLDLKVDQDAENIKSYLAAGDIINGDLEVKGGARIDGHVRGSLICQNGSAVVGESGTVDGSVTATKRVIVAGKVGQGEKAGSSAVDCPGEVIVLGSGVIESTVCYGSIATYDDGQITGKISRHAKR